MRFDGLLQGLEVEFGCLDELIQVLLGEVEFEFHACHLHHDLVDFADEAGLGFPFEVLFGLPQKTLQKEFGFEVSM